MNDVENRSKRPRRDLQWKRLGAELIVVFIGVYLAFLLDGVRSQWEEEQKRSRVLSALLRETRQSARDLELVEDAFETLSSSWLDEYENGEMPELRGFHFVYSSRHDVWEATLQSGILEIVDVGVVFSLSNHYAQMDFAAAQVEAFDRFVSEHIIPKLDEGNAEFYDPDTKELKLRYRWYAGHLMGIGQAISGARVSLEQVKKTLIEAGAS